MIVASQVRSRYRPQHGPPANPVPGTRGIDKRDQKGLLSFRFQVTEKVFFAQKGTVLRHFIVWVASAGYSGYCPLAPGTCGTAVGVLVYLLFSSFPAPVYVLSVVTLLFRASWVAGRAEILFGEHDSPKITIDEVIGYMITVSFLPLTLTTLAGGFLFFRVFDIIKPPPAGAINRRQGGWAVVLDDVVVGLYVNLLIRALAHWNPHLLSTLDRCLGLP